MSILLLHSIYPFILYIWCYITMVSSKFASGEREVLITQLVYIYNSHD